MTANIVSRALPKRDRGDASVILPTRCPLRVDSVEKIANPESLKFCSITNDIFGQK
jgi:hypothetical protein